jgi:hypothetical protein
MPIFKKKNIKIPILNKKKLITLDGTHREFMNEFNRDEVINIPQLKTERKKWKEKLQNTENIEEILECQDKIDNINKSIKALNQKKKDYFLDNSSYIFDYFENKKNIGETNANNAPQVAGNKMKMIDAFFKIKTNVDSNVIENNNNNIFQKYLSNIDESFLDINSFLTPVDVCQSCYKGELIAVEDEGVLICTNCSKNYQYLIENEKPSYKEPPKEICFYAYKKINHFKEILAQFQGKETTQIPQEVIENLKLQIKKERIDISSLNYYTTKALLKKLSYNKYYEHINFIKNKLGIKPPIISQELEDLLCNFFMEIQYPYAKFCPDYRVNFLHYYYVLYKLFELIGETQYLDEIPMLKDRDKLIEQDSIWKKICLEKDWEYIATV